MCCAWSKAFGWLKKLVVMKDRVQRDERDCEARVMTREIARPTAGMWNKELSNDKMHRQVMVMKECGCCGEEREEGW